METIFSVTNMHCSACEKVITKTLTRLPGVTAVSVDSATGQVRVTSKEPVPQNDIIDSLTVHDYSVEF